MDPEEAKAWFVDWASGLGYQISIDDLVIQKKLSTLSIWSRSTAESWNDLNAEKMPTMSLTVCAPLRVQVLLINFRMIVAAFLVALDSFVMAPFALYVWWPELLRD